MHRVDEVGNGGVEHRLADDRVTKRHDAAARLEQAGPHAGGERVAHGRVIGLGHRDHQRRVEVTDHGSGDDDPALCRIEQPEARLGELANGAGHGRVALAPDGRAVVHLHRSGSHVREHHLFDEERHTVGSADDVVDELGGWVGVEQRGDEVRDVACGERIDRQDLDDAVAAQRPQHSSATGASPVLIAAMTVTPSIPA